MRCVRQRLVIEFKGYHITKLVSLLNNVDDMCFSILSHSLEDIQKRITRHDNIFSI